MAFAIIWSTILIAIALISICYLIKDPETFFKIQDALMPLNAKLAPTDKKTRQTMTLLTMSCLLLFFVGLFIYTLFHG